jgi:hypothetical protein
MKKKAYILIITLLLAAAAFSDAHADDADQSNFNAYYGSDKGLECVVCHTSYGRSSRNSYGSAYERAGGSRTSIGNIAQADSDGDSFSNDIEINAGTNPGNAASRPDGTGTPSVNRSPVVDAGPSNYSVSSGGSIVLSGSAVDPDAGDTLIIAWTQSGTATGRFANAAAAGTTFTAPSVQTSTVISLQLKATDRAGLTSTDTASVTVIAAGSPLPNNNPPVANAGLDMMVLPGTFGNLDGFYSSDPDGGIASYTWEQVGDPAVTLSDPTAMDPVFQAPDISATLTFRLIVTDNGGLQSSDTVTVVVHATDETPLPPPPSDGGDNDDNDDDDDDDDDDD